MFTPLPTGFEQLEQVLNQLKKVRPIKPPQFIELGQQLRSVYERHSKQNYKHLTLSEWRQLPYALWVSGQTDLVDLHPELVRSYWEEKLPEMLAANPRRSRRWLMPLFFVYCISFNKKSKNFFNFSISLQDVLSIMRSPEAEKLSELHSKYKFFSPNLVGNYLSSLFFNSEQPLNHLMYESLLWPGFEDTKLGLEILQTGLNQSEHELRNTHVAQRLMSWEQEMQVRVVKTDLRIEFANSLLGVWDKNKQIAEPLKKSLVEFFLRDYGDPRSSYKANYQWQGVNSVSIKVMKYLLAGDSLKSFMRILEKTADEIWEYRQKFWMAYYDAGHIEEAWLVLGSNARVMAGQMSITHSNYGRLESGVQPNHSVLLLRIGNLVFSEWSHSGSMRAYKRDNPKGPILYRSIYYGDELRELESLDFHNGENKRKELGHFHSDSGTWQNKARDLIHAHTGIYLSTTRILL